MRGYSSLKEKNAKRLEGIFGLSPFHGPGAGLKRSSDPGSLAERIIRRGRCIRTGETTVETEERGDVVLFLSGRFPSAFRPCNNQASQGMRRTMAAGCRTRLVDRLRGLTIPVIGHQARPQHASDADGPHGANPGRNPVPPKGTAGPDQGPGGVGAAGHLAAANRFRSPVRFASSRRGAANRHAASPSDPTPRLVPQGPVVQPGDLQATPLEAAPRPSPSLSPFQAPPPIQVETRALFEEAYADYYQRNYPTAAEKFLLVYQYAKEPERKARSLYWAGVCHFRNQDWIKAIQCFSQMEKEFPEDAALPGALLRKGYSYIYLGDSREGARVLRGLLQRFPKSEEALPARERLREMGES